MRVLLLVSLGVLVAATAAAQQPPILAVAARDTAPVVDGKVSPQEYGGTLEIGRYSVSLSAVGTEIYLGISARTAGWVAVGLGSLKMAGATILMGYVNRDGLRLKVQRGVGHTHTDAPGPFLLASAGTEIDGRTTIELRLDAAPFLATGASEIRMIGAFGNTDSFTVAHVFRTPLLARLGS